MEAFQAVLLPVVQDSLTYSDMLVDLCVEGQIAGHSGAKVSEMVGDLEYRVVWSMQGLELHIYSPRSALCRGHSNLAIQ